MRSWWLRFLPLARPQSWRIAALGGVGLVGVALEALLPWPLKLIIDHVLVHQPLPAPVGWVGALPGADSSGGALAWLTLAVLLVFLCLQAMQLVKGVLQADISSRLHLTLAAQVFDRLQALSLSYHRRARRGDLLRRVTSDSACLSTLVTEVLMPVFLATLSLAVLFAIMWHLDATLAIVASLVALPMLALIRLLGPRMSERAYLQQEAEGAVWAVAEQTLTAIPVVQGFGREEHEESRFMGMADRSVRAYLHTLSSQIQFRVGIDASEAFGIAAIIMIGGYHVLEGTISVGTLVVFLSYLTALYAPLLAFAYLAMTAASAAGSARRVEQVLDATDMVHQAPNAVPLKGAASHGRRGHVKLEGIVFGYEPGVPVLRDIDLEALPGQTLALVGASGAGKSTLVSLVPRLFDPWEGRVLIDGQDLRQATIASVRDSVGYVMQDPFLLPMSIADNIAYGRPSATRAEVQAVARHAGADEFIQRMAQRYDTVIGERGITLSGGQRQRLSIARALLKDAPVLIMDEPTSALDLETEQVVLDALDRLAAGRTTIVIAHRLSTVRRADRIVVLDQGEIAASGTHAELLAGSSLYRTLYQSQLAPQRDAKVGTPERGA